MMKWLRKRKWPEQSRAGRANIQMGLLKMQFMPTERNNNNSDGGGGSGRFISSTHRGMLAQAPNESRPAGRLSCSQRQVFAFRSFRSPLGAKR